MQDISPSSRASRASARRAPRPATLAVVDRCAINIADPDHAMDQIIAAAERGECFSAVPLNVDHLVRLRESAELAAAISAAQFVTAEGAPIARIAATQDYRVLRVAGPDLIQPIATAAVVAKLPIYLVGSDSGTLARAGEALAAHCDYRLSIAGTSTASTDLDPQSDAADALLDRIAASGARVCFVALTTPTQEIFAARGVERGIACGFVCVGVGLDYLAGALMRAPRILRNSGLEWAWQLAANPRENVRRYARSAMLLARLSYS
jgi:exopolysaccharide biosynthesis WecB/TagA/CpsF family protein